MKTGLLRLSAVIVLATFGSLSAAHADSASANCELRKDGDTRAGASGPCTFSQRQGYIDLRLKNGDTYSLSPAGKTDKYRDQKGNTVTRTVNGNTEVFRWDNGKKIIMTYASSASSAGYAPPASGSAATRNDEFRTVCGVIVNGQQYKYRCSATDVYAGGQKVKTILRYPDQTIELTWKGGNRIGLQFEGMVPMEARYATSEGETNFVFEDKTYFYYSNKEVASMELQHFKN